MKIKQLFTLALAAGISATSVAETEYNLDIINNASLTYSVSSAPSNIEVTASETFKVDRKVIFNLTQINTSASTGIITKQIAVRYTLTNNSNAPIRFAPTIIDANGTGTAYSGASEVTDNTDNTKTPGYEFYYEAIGDGFDTGTSETNITSIGYVELDQDQEITLYVVVTPTIGLDQDIYVHGLTVTAQEHTDTPSVISGAVVGAEVTSTSADWNKDIVQTVLDATAGGSIRGDNGAVIVSSATLKMVKTVKVLSDEFGNTFPNAKAIPGAVVEYTLAITNSGSVDADNVVISDDVPTNGFDLTDAYEELFSVTDNSGATTYPTAGSGVTVGTATATATPVTFASVTVPANDGSVDGKVVVTLTATLK